MAVQQKTALPLGQKEIMEILPHRPPFLWVDMIIELEPGQSAKGLFFADPSYDFFAGHFPGNPVMPGVLIIEVMNQVGAVALLSSPQLRGKFPIFLEVTAKFKKPVKPGDKLEIVVEKKWQRGSFGGCSGTVSVNGEPVAFGTVSFAVVDEL